MSQIEAYHWARVASNQILADAYQAADQRFGAAITGADVKLHQARFSVEAKAARDATYAVAR
jgi:hypothetical protein